MPGLLFCKHFKELGGKVKDGVHKRQDQKGMLLFSGWIDAIDAIDAIADMGFWGCGLGGMEENKKSASPKKTAPVANSGASCVSRVAWPYLWILATTDPL